jgi:salicylate hydroxylase
LAECLSRVTSKDDIPKLLHAFETIRKPRCERLQRLSRANGDRWQIFDSVEELKTHQHKRQMEMLAEDREHLLDDEDDDSRGNGFSNDLHPWMFGYDAAKYVSMPNRRDFASLLTPSRRTAS